MLPAQIRGSVLFYALLALVLVAALNWLLVGALDLDLVVLATGGKQPRTRYDAAARAVYVGVGAAALGLIALLAAQKMRRARK